MDKSFTSIPVSDWNTSSFLISFEKISRAYTLPKTILMDMDYKNVITIEPDKRGGKPCIRGMRITVYDILEYLASGMREEDILDDFPELKKEDIRASLQFISN